MRNFLEELNTRSEIGMYSRVGIFSFSNRTEKNAGLDENLDMYTLQDVIANDYGITLQGAGTELALALQDIYKHVVENERFDEMGVVKAGQAVLIFSSAQPCGHLNACGRNTRRNVLTGIRALVNRGISVYIVGKCFIKCGIMQTIFNYI